MNTISKYQMAEILEYLDAAAADGRPLPSQGSKALPPGTSAWRADFRLGAMP